MFVDVVTKEEQEKVGSNRGVTKVGVDSKYNTGEAELVVRCNGGVDVKIL